MSVRAKVEIFCGVIILVLAGVGFFAWLSEHDARLKADTDAKARQEAFDKAADQIKQIQDKADQRDRESAAHVNQLVQAAMSAKTPVQIAGYSQAQLEAAISGIKITIPPATAADPHPAAIATIPEASLPQLRDTIEKCQVQGVQLTTCSSDLEDRKKQQALAQTQIEQLQKEVVDYKKAAGKTFWQRAWNNAIKPGLFAGGGYLVGRATAPKK